MIWRNSLSALLAFPGAVRLKSSNQRLTSAGAMRSSGVSPKAGSSRASSIHRTPFLVEGLKRSKRTSFHSPATKSRNRGTAFSGSTVRSGSGLARRAWHALRASCTPIADTRPSVTRRDPFPALLSMTQVIPPEGRTRTPRPGTRVSQTVYS